MYVYKGRYKGYPDNPDNPVASALTALLGRFGVVLPPVVESDPPPILDPSPLDPVPDPVHLDPVPDPVPTPPANATIYWCDREGRSMVTADKAYMWTWTGASTWLYVAEHPLPPVVEDKPVITKFRKKPYPTGSGRLKVPA